MQVSLDAWLKKKQKSVDEQSCDSASTNTFSEQNKIEPSAPNLDNEKTQIESNVQSASNEQNENKTDSNTSTQNNDIAAYVGTITKYTPLTNRWIPSELYSFPFSGNRNLKFQRK